MDERRCEGEDGQPEEVGCGAHEGPLVTLQTGSLLGAELARGKLQSEGIPAFIVDGNTSLAVPHVPVRLQV